METSSNHPQEIPTPDNLHNKFILPREYIRVLSAWMNVSESLAYQICRQGRLPAKRTISQLEDRCGIPPHLWDEEDLDTRIKNLYTYWYIQNL